MAFTVQTPDGQTIGQGGNGKWSHVIIAKADLGHFQALAAESANTIAGYVERGSWTPEEAAVNKRHWDQRLAAMEAQPWLIYSTHKSEAAAQRTLRQAKDDDGYTNARIVEL